MTEIHNFILFADDDVDDQELIKMAFEMTTSGYSCEIVNNGQEALNVLRQHNHLPCVIVLDVNMPVMDGIQTLKKLKAYSEFDKIPKVILTTSDNDENRKISYLNGAVDYLVKPETMKDLVTTVQKILSYCQ